MIYKYAFALLLIAGLAFAIQPVEDWTLVSTGKYEPIPDAGYVTEGGNVTNIDLDSNISTEKWAGFWGNVTGELVLAQASGGAMFYTWTWDAGDGGEVCALIDTSFDWTSIFSVTANAVDDAWSFATGDTDSATSTFDESCDITVAGTTVTGTNATTTLGGGGFQTCAIADVAATPAKGNIAFCVEIQDAAALFNAGTGDYQLLTATNETAGEYETYHFWLELN